MEGDKQVVQLSCLVHTPGAEPKLHIKVKGEVILLAEGETANLIFAAIRDEWKKHPEFGYDLELKPYDCDHVKEGKIITLIKKSK